ncbi:MAG: nicotinate-nucleotide adenylyltransferase [Eubacteriales bacterium]|nr:nicotinate-nucleotide adenylyltransferase [Eubacteriales bacterium]
MKKRNIGIMGGTFDPVHNAHLTLARQAYEQFSLDAVWMLPNGNPPHKKDHTQADARHRIEMVRQAVQGIPYLELCGLERSMDECHYTYETLRLLGETYPDVQFYFIMGADSLFDFDSWKEPDVISRECILLAAARDLHRRAQLEEKIRSLEARYGADIRILDTPDMRIASEEIRARLRRGEDVSRMLPPAVEDYIRRHHLYEKESADGCDLY